MKQYRINEIFFSLQGEGVRSGTANVFVRFSKCNLACSKEGPAGFACDTEFESGRDMSPEDLLIEIENTGRGCRNVIFTGGEPALQVDAALIGPLKQNGCHLSIETNGTLELPNGLDWVCVSPKSAEHTLRVKGPINELKYVRHKGQAIPQPSLKADHYLISPAFDPHGFNRENLEWCIELVKENPMWRLSVQQHKTWGVR